jgi:hypothetical protein
MSRSRPLLASVLLCCAGARAAAAEPRRVLAELDAAGGVPLGEGRIDEFNLVSRGSALGVSVGLPRGQGALLLRTQVAWAGGADGEVTLVSLGPTVRLARSLDPLVTLHGEVHVGALAAVPGDGAGSWLGVGVEARVAAGLTWWCTPRVGVGAEAAVTTFAYSYLSGEFAPYGPTLMTGGVALRTRL